MLNLKTKPVELPLFPPAPRDVLEHMIGLMHAGRPSFLDSFQELRVTFMELKNEGGRDEATRDILVQVSDLTRCLYRQVEAEARVLEG